MTSGNGKILKSVSSKLLLDFLVTIEADSSISIDGVVLRIMDALKSQTGVNGLSVEYMGDMVDPEMEDDFENPHLVGDWAEFPRDVEGH